ncbi:flavodoxin [Myceligenerans sp. I2]|uniref:Flavodoxin n=2 Tax=Myceligenerans indicum TaxID=2593663 RepID=A0ABS1LID6_9MICO|nr:flavodoxin [Myceligenerans indicum]
MFGNTEALAQVIGAGIRASMPTDVVEVGAAPDVVPSDVTLLVVGGPTHAFGMSWPSTRRDAAGMTSDVISRHHGIREWLGALPGSVTGADAATFDTRVTSYITGSAARAAGRRLARLGYRIVVAPASFRVTDVQGPLAEGELDRARQWGKTLGTRATATSSGGLTY